MTHRLGVDIGGTFTDFAILDISSGRLATHKQLTTPENFSVSVLTGLDALLRREHVPIGGLSAIIHGTTLVTNATIERKGAPVCMLVTAGFRDVLALAKETRYDLYDLRLRFASPVVPRSLRLEVEERVMYDGSVGTPLDLDAVRRDLAELRSRERIEAVAICFLHAYANPEHERAVQAMLRLEHPDLHVSVSSEISPVMREFERWTTTTVNAYNQPMIDRYLGALESGLEQRGFAGKFHLMTSNGGTVSSAAARRFPVRLMESGPAAGVLMSARHGRHLGLPELLSFDMGGTTSKGALLSDFAPLKHYQFEVARSHNFKRGSGLPILIPVIDMIEIGTGGGSIAAVDRRGVVRVGPRSAGARPGPACYGLGGTAATLTDANLLLGYLDASFFLGGQMKIAPEAAAAAIDAEIGAPLGLEVVRAAWGIHETANEDVARAFRVHAAERGFDYRACSMIAFGGSGPIHALRIARKLHIPRVIFPVGAGVMSAFGLLVSPMNNEAVRTDPVFLAGLTPEEFERRFAALEQEAASLIEPAGVARADIATLRRLDMRYRGQGYQVTVELPPGVVGRAALDLISAAFDAEYRRIFAITFGDQPLEIVDWKVEAIGPPPPMPAHGLRLADIAPRAPGASLKGRRRAWFPEPAAFVECPVHDRYALAPGERISGPALIEDKESTCVIGVGETACVDAAFNLVAEVATSDPKRLVAGAAGDGVRSAYDSIDLGIMWDRLISITDEIVSALIRTSFSTIVRESGDLSCVLFDADGNTLAQGTYSVPSFTGTAPVTLRHMLRRFPRETLRPGDVIMTNDPWMGTGHLFDVSVMRPVFRGATHVGFTLSVTHLADIGGLGFTTTTTEIFEEGMQIPISKLVREGVLNEDLMEIILKNVRLPEMVRGDLLANITCNEVGGRALVEFMDEYGVDDLRTLSAAIIGQSERLMRDQIRAIPDGVYRNTVQIEGTDGPVTLAGAVHVRGDSIHLDFTGTGPVVKRGINVPFCYTRAFTLYALKCLLLPELPNNEGCSNPITLEAPENCILNAQPPWPTGGRHIFGHYVAPLINGALRGALPDRVPAETGMLSQLNCQGLHREGRRISTIYFCAGGYGALDGFDGHAATPAPSNMIGSPTEVFEHETSLSVLSKRLIADSGGAGRYAGGPGPEIVLRNDTTHPLQLSCFAGRTRFAAQGVDGGRDGGLRQHRINGEPVDSKGRYMLQPGDIVTVHEAGGAGFGDPRERSAAQLELDVEAGHRSVEGVLRDFGVDLVAYRASARAAAT